MQMFRHGAAQEAFASTEFSLFSHDIKTKLENSQEVNYVWRPVTCVQKALYVF